MVACNMVNSRRKIGLFFVAIMIVGTANGRWLEHDEPMLSDGVHDDNGYENGENLEMVVDFSESRQTGKRCESIYGFLPCADTMEEGVFLMLMYTYLMMLGEEWIGKGSMALFVLLGDKAFGASVFRVLMAIPSIVIVIVSGVLSTASDAQDLVTFSVGMYAGSTVISLTLIWGFRVILSRDKLRGKVHIRREHDEIVGDSSSTCLPLKQKLTIFTDQGVNIDKETGYIAVQMLISLIPFAIVQLVHMFESPITSLLALIVSAVSLLLYFAYQILNPWIQVRSLTYLKQKNLQTRFFYHVQKLAQDDLIDGQGNPNFEAFERIFTRADSDNDKCISHDELEHLIQDIFKLQDDQISKDYAKAEISTHFDGNENGKIDWPEFKSGCTHWLENWKNVAKKSNSFSLNIWEQVEKIAVENKQAELSTIELIMPRILKQVLEKHDLVKENGEPDRSEIEGLFCTYDKDNNDSIRKDELKQFIDTMHFGVSLDHETVLKEVCSDFDNNEDGSIEKEEFVDGFSKWIEKAINNDPSIKDPKTAIAKFEQDFWEEIDTPLKMEKPEAGIVYIICGVGLMYLISGPFIQSVVQFSGAAHIPYRFTSFVMAPIALNARMVIMAILYVSPHNSKNASLTFSEIYSGLVMNNLLGLSTLLAVVYAKGLSWTNSAEVLTIMIPCAIVGLFAFKRSTYPLWTSILAILLYPVSIYLYYVLNHVF